MSATSQTRADQHETARRPTAEPAAPAAEEPAVPLPAAALQPAPATPPPKPRPAELLALQRAAGNQSVGRMLGRLAAPAGQIQRHPAIPNWSTRAQAARRFVQARQRAQAMAAYQALIADVINTIPPASYPASLTTAPTGGSAAPTPVAPGTVTVGLRNQPGGAVTYQSEVETSRGNPAHLWRWIEFHEEAITDTEEWTRGLILHELEHAGDMVTAFRAWSALAPTARPLWLEYWQTWMRDRPARHVGIYEAQAGAGRFAAWSDDEKLEWITGVLGNVPDNLRGGASFPGRARINTYYGQVQAAPQGQAVQELFWEMLFGGQRDRTNPLQKVTILNNFTQVRDDLLAGRRHGDAMRDQIAILRQVLRRR